jgi:trehalose synthase-fused probable maltokinase
VIAERFVELLDEQALIAFVRERRWFGSKAQNVTHASVLDTALVRTQPPLLAITLAELGFGAGTHENYQLLLGLRPEDDAWDADVVGNVEGWTIYDGMSDPLLARELLHLMRAGSTLNTDEGALEFRPVDRSSFGTDLPDPRPIGVEQSNTSVVFGDELILKAYRRLEAGINPELELLLFLTKREFPNVAALAGWYSYAGRPMDATLGVVQRFLPEGRDGWELAIDELQSDPEAFLGRVRRLGEVTGAMHTALASDTSDPDFAPEEPSAESVALLTATVDEEIEAIFLDLPAGDELSDIAGRGEEVREHLRQISTVGAVGRAIRTHGDYHLGQVLWADDDWVVLDFEGEPARSLPERRRKRSPLRDVAGMLRSFAYAVSAARIAHGADPPSDWEERARSEFLGGYFAEVDASLVPPGDDARRRLLSVFELEKAAYELRYELNNRPDWVRIPVAGIARLLDG